MNDISPFKNVTHNFIELNVFIKKANKINLFVFITFICFEIVNSCLKVQHVCTVCKVTNTIVENIGLNFITWLIFIVMHQAKVALSKNYLEVFDLQAFLY